MNPDLDEPAAASDASSSAQRDYADLPSGTTGNPSSSETNECLAKNDHMAVAGDDNGDTRSGSGTDGNTTSSLGTSIHDMVKLFQCRQCSKPFSQPVTLPCGKSVCRSCIPLAHDRSSITYPAMPERRQGFVCPFDACAKEHSLGDCCVDVVLSKLVLHMREKARQDGISHSDADIAEAIRATQDSSPKGDVEDAENEVLASLTKIWSLAEQLRLTDLEHDERLARVAATLVDVKSAALAKFHEVLRPEVDCQVCYALFIDPITTGCGHTFCRSCLYRTLDHSRYCPVCRRKLSISPRLQIDSTPFNEKLNNTINTFWRDELQARKEVLATEEAARLEDLNTALFICTLSFPQMPTFLHVFEPRYRLMIRRSMENDRTFGMVYADESGTSDSAEFYELGTLLRIKNVEFYPDGRCLLETVGVSRFRVIRHEYLDGYIIAKTERVDDISLEAEEAIEATEVAAHEPLIEEEATQQQILNDDAQSAVSAHSRQSSITVQSFESMPTQELMRYATDFVARQRAQSVPWLTSRVLAIYGDCPEDPAIFPWWLASILPVKLNEKYRLLSTSSVRARLKICCGWILEWESRLW